MKVAGDEEGGQAMSKLNEFLHQRETIKELRQVCMRGEKSLVVHFDRILEFNMELAKRLLDCPTKFLGEANCELEQIVKCPGKCLRVRGLDKTLNTSEIWAEHVDRFVQVSGAVTHVSNHRLRMVRSGDDSDMREFEDYQEVRLDDFLVTVLKRDLVGKVKLGDQIIITGALGAVKDGEFYDFVLEANHLEGYAPSPGGFNRRGLAGGSEGSGADLKKREVQDTAKELEKNPLLGDKTGLSIYDLEMELKSIFTRTMGNEAAEQLIDAFDKMIDIMRKKNNPLPVIVMIDEHGKVVGSLVNCPTVRERLRRDGFEICGSVATKQRPRR